MWHIRSFWMKLKNLLWRSRVLRKRPGFTCVAVLMLGLGIGPNTALFMVVNAILFWPLPFSSPYRFVSLVDFYSRIPRGMVRLFLDFDSCSRMLQCCHIRRERSRARYAQSIDNAFALRLQQRSQQ